MEQQKGEGGAATGAEESKSVYLFVCRLDGPNAHALYAVDFPLPVSSPEQEQERPLPPLVEFPRAKYPLGMCAVEFDSKLYILGGEYAGPDLGGPPQDPVDFCLYPRDVHIFDPTSTCPSSLKVGPKMNTGKFKHYAFVADFKIYVVSGIGSRTDWNLSRFEVFKPDVDGGGGTWTQLEDPPFRGTIFTNRQVFLSTWDWEFLCFDLDSSEWWRKIWVNCSSCWTRVLKEDLIWFPCEGSVISPFLRSTKLVEGTLFCCNQNYGVVSFGPAVDNNKWSPEEEEEEDQLFDKTTFLAPGMIPRIRYQLLYPSVSLTHMGNRLFCHVFFGNYVEPITPPNPYVKDPTKSFVKLTTFEALKDCFEEEEGYSTLVDAFTLPS